MDGKTTNLYILSNKNGMEVCITNYGGRIVSMMVPDRKGKLQDVVLGFDSIGSYLRFPSNLGAVVGRYAEGIHSKKMNYHPVKDPTDVDSENKSHGFQNKVFDAQQFGNKKLVLTYISKDGECSKANCTRSTASSRFMRKRVMLGSVTVSGSPTLADAVDEQRDDAAAQGAHDVAVAGAADGWCGRRCGRWRR